MTTRLQQPNYSAEIAAKVTILNFAVTTTALDELLLNAIVSRERPDVAAEKTQLTTQQADTRRTLCDEENKILSALTSDENVLESDAAVQTISTSKMMINELLEKFTVGKSGEQQIDVCRNAYERLAQHASIIYFTIGENDFNDIVFVFAFTQRSFLFRLFFIAAEMAKLNSMYQYSLNWFVNHFTSAIDNTDKVDDVQQRVKDLIQYFSFFIFLKICRGLFEKVYFPPLFSSYSSQLD